MGTCEDDNIKEPPVSSRNNMALAHHRFVFSVLVLQLMNSMALHKVVILSQPQFPHL